MIGMGFTGGVDEAWPSEVTHVRLWDQGVHWGAIHTAPDTYDWSVLDALVAKAAGKTIVYVIGACPRWLAKYPDNPHYAPWLGPGSNSMPYSLDEANKFAWNLATRYKGRIKAYEVWNEPQLADFLYPYNDTECNALAAGVVWWHDSCPPLPDRDAAEGLERGCVHLPHLPGGRVRCGTVGEHASGRGVHAQEHGGADVETVDHGDSV